MSNSNSDRLTFSKATALGPSSPYLYDLIQSLKQRWHSVEGYLAENAYALPVAVAIDVSQDDPCFLHLRADRASKDEVRIDVAYSDPFDEEKPLSWRHITSMPVEVMVACSEYLPALLKEIESEVASKANRIEVAISAIEDVLVTLEQSRNQAKQGGE